jgi:hypothetical protein
MSDLRLGEGTETNDPGRRLPDDLASGIFVAQEHFTIHEQQQGSGVILSERKRPSWSPASWVGIFVTPPRPGAAEYTVEVIRRHNGGARIFSQPQNWEAKVLRELPRTLGFKATR